VAELTEQQARLFAAGMYALLMEVRAHNAAREIDDELLERIDQAISGFDDVVYPSAAPSQDSLQLREGDATGNSGAACATEQECDGMPWCRIEGKCRKAQTTTTAAPPTPGDQQ
jgi:hypothetical protein